MAFTLKKNGVAMYMVLKNGDAVGAISKTPSGWYCLNRTSDLLSIGPFITRDNALKGFVKWYGEYKPDQD